MEVGDVTHCCSHFRITLARMLPCRSNISYSNATDESQLQQVVSVVTLKGFGAYVSSLIAAGLPSNGSIGYIPDAPKLERVFVASAATGFTQLYAAEVQPYGAQHTLSASSQLGARLAVGWQPDVFAALPSGRDLPFVKQSALLALPGSSLVYLDSGVQGFGAFVKVGTGFLPSC